MNPKIKKGDAFQAIVLPYRCRTVLTRANQTGKIAHGRSFIAEDVTSVYITSGNKRFYSIMFRFRKVKTG